VAGDDTRNRKLARRRRGAAAIVAVTLLGTAAGAAVIAFAGDESSEGTAGSPPSRIAIAPPGEPGTPLVFSGTVYRPDGTTPAPGVVLYVYQTDAKGIYGPPGAAPRLRGWLRTDDQGRYEVRTIRPGSYPTGGIAAHVHTQLWGGGAATQWNSDLLFAGDPDLSQRELREAESAGRFASICTPTKDSDGTLRCPLDLRLRAEASHIQSGTRHGLDDAPAWARP
jgi:protocatechuate 3,4-dioxygenase beta subunit